MFARFLAGALLLLPVVPVHALPPHQWSRGFGAPDHFWATSVALDSHRNVFVTGWLQGGTVSTGAGSLVCAGGTDVVIMSLDDGGALRWARVFGDAADQNPRALAVDPSGNVFLAGMLKGSANFGGGVLTSAGDSDIFLAKFSNDGDHLWSKRFGDARRQMVSALAIDASGSVVITGNFEGSFTFGGANFGRCGVWNDLFQCLDASDIFLARFDGDGVNVWSREFDARDWQNGNELAFDPSGNILLAGSYSVELDLGGGPLPTPGHGLFLAKLTPTGEHVWSRGLGGSDAEYAVGLAVDPLGNPAIAGIFAGTASFGGATFQNDGATSTWDTFVAGFDVNGNHRWSHHISGFQNQQATDLVVDNSGAAHVAGYFLVSMTAGGQNVFSNSFVTPFVSSFDESGGYIGSTAFRPADGNAFLMAIAGNNDRIALAGAFQGALDLGGGQIWNRTSGITEDLFVGVLGSPIPVLITGFEARARANAVDVSWSLWSDEAIDGFSLNRDTSPQGTPMEIARGAVSGTTGSYRDSDVQPGVTYSYELVLRSSDGDEIRSQPALVTVPALRTSLGANTPNPFRAATTLAYTVAERGEVSIGIYDVRGARVAVLSDGVRDPGSYRVVWNGRDDTGRAVASGVYFYRFEGDRAIEAKKMILIE